MPLERHPNLASKVCDKGDICFPPWSLLKNACTCLVQKLCVVFVSGCITVWIQHPTGKSPLEVGHNWWWNQVGRNPEGVRIGKSNSPFCETALEIPLFFPSVGNQRSRLTLHQGKKIILKLNTCLEDWTLLYVSLSAKCFISFVNLQNSFKAGSGAMMIIIIF